MTEVVLETLFESPSLLIRYLPGSGSRLVVAFMGVGLAIGGIQPEEFVGSASQGMSNHVAFVMDLERSWYSAPGLQPSILAALTQLIAEAQITEVVCLGNSMGGHGALLFASRLGAKSAIALVPQFSMNPALVNEERWPQFHPSIRIESLGDLRKEMSASVENHVFFGADSPPDMAHLRLFLKTGKCKVHLLRRCGHGLADRLKKLGLLQPMIAAIIGGDTLGPNKLLWRELASRQLKKHEGYAYDSV